MRRAAAIATCLLALAAATAARQSGGPADLTASPPPPVDLPSTSLSPWLRFEEPGPFEALLAWYPPLLVRNGSALKDFIRTREFAAWRRFAGDPRAVDAIWVRAMALTANNTAAALLLATTATFDHYLVGLRVPVLNLFFPLSGESYDDYAARVRNLPADFYADTPPGRHGDRDKLQHFFGSAFVAFAFESRGASRRVGEFIELGEEAAIVDGVLDDRDRRANWNGTEFGLALLADNRRYPSEFLRTMVVGGQGGASMAFGRAQAGPRATSPEDCR